MSYDIIEMASTGSLEAFVIVKLQEYLLHSWNSSDNCSKKRKEDGILCNITKGTICIQLTNDLAAKVPIYIYPHFPEVDLLTTFTHQLYVIKFIL